MAQLATGEKYLQADRIIHRALIEHYDLYIKEIRDGFEYYSLFHRKGTPVTHSFPQYLYIRERDIFQPVPETVSDKPKPTGRVAAQMITRIYESEISFGECF